MTLNDLAQGEPWMNPEERQTVSGLVQSFQQSFTNRQIPEDPFLVLRVEDLLLHHTLCRRLERNLTPEPGPDAATPAPVTPALAAHIVRARNSRRKALKEIEDTANKLAPKTSAPSSNLPSDSSSAPVSSQFPTSPEKEASSPKVAAPPETPDAATSHTSPCSQALPPTANTSPAAPSPIPQANPHVPVSRPLPPHIFRHR